MGGAVEYNAMVVCPVCTGLRLHFVIKDIVNNHVSEASVYCEDCGEVVDYYAYGYYESESEEPMKPADFKPTKENPWPTLANGGIVPGKPDDTNAAVYTPKHYSIIGDLESIHVIARAMTVEQFYGFCLGNIIKYRMRLGNKDAIEQDLKKADNYKVLYEKYKVLCHDWFEQGAKL